MSKNGYDKLVKVSTGRYVAPCKHQLVLVGFVPYEDGTYTVMWECDGFLCGYCYEEDVSPILFDLLETMKRRIETK